MLTKTSILVTLRSDHTETKVPLELIDSPPTPYAILSYDGDGESAWVLKLDRDKIRKLEFPAIAAEATYDGVLSTSQAVLTRLPLVD